MNIKKYILFFLFTTTFVTTRGQIIGSNLVQNPSFEQYTQCPWSSGQLNFANFWWGNNSEYYNTCANNNGFSCPSNYSGFQYPRTGNAYAGFTIYLGPQQLGNPLFQESIKNLLCDSLKEGKRYCIDYYISLSDEMVIIATLHNIPMIYDSICALVSEQLGQDVTYPLPCDTCAKSTKPLLGNVDTLNWHRIAGSVIAKGGEKYLKIGKFYDVIWPPNSKTEFYIYVDDVSVCECAYNINLGMDTKLCEGESLLLNATLPNATYIWQDGSHAATYEVKQPGTYWVTAYVAEYDITSSDTIIITAEEENVCNTPLIIPNFISPNNDNINDNFQIGNADKYDISLQVYNRWGRLICQTAHYTNDYNCNGCADGVYYYLLTAKSLRSGKVKDYKGSLTVMH